MSQRVKKFGNDVHNQVIVTLNTDVMDLMMNEFGRPYAVQVGVLGVKAQGTRLKIEKENLGTVSNNRKVAIASDSGQTNAEIGLTHEKGSAARNIPRRSFLEEPLTSRLPLMMSKVAGLLWSGVTSLNMMNSYKKLALLCEGIVLQAFPTRGYGTWPNKANGQPSRLIDTGQLRQSIASRVTRE